MYCIIYLLSSDGHLDRVIFYNNECIKFVHIMVHLLMQRGGGGLKCKVMKAVKFIYFYCNVRIVINLKHLCIYQKLTNPKVSYIYRLS